jgi:Photosynthetic reaction centre cytochrome C subunit
MKSRTAHSRPARSHLIFGLLMVAMPMLAQEPQQPQPPQPPAQGPRRPPPVPKNLKLLDPETLMPTMMSFKAALGVECSFCHVQGDFASDDKPTKDMARKMIVMTRSINANFPDGKIHVTCYTCHRGSTEPKTAPEAQ